MNTRRLSPRLRAVVMLAAVALGLGLVVATDADARSRGRVHLGVWVGGPLWWGGIPFGYPYYVDRPVIVHAPAETVVMPSAAQQVHSWYYCREAQMYYPYVTQCPSAWQEVPATPAPAAVAETPAPPVQAPVPAARTPGTPVPPAPSK